MDNHKRSTFEDDSIDVADMPKEMEQASEEVRSERKIRKVNYSKAFAMYGKPAADSGKNTSAPERHESESADASDPPQEQNPAENEGKPHNPFETLFKKLKKESAETKIAHVEALESAEAEKTQETSTKEETPKAEETSKTGGNPSELKPSTETNPFATSASNPFSFTWDPSKSFTASANRPSEAPQAEEEDEPLAEEETQHASSEKSTLEGETLAARCHVKAFQLNAEGREWKEIGTGYAKLTVHDDLAAARDDIAAEFNFARISFHDSRSGMQRINLPLGSALAISPAKGETDKKLIFTATVCIGEGEAAKLEKQTFLIKEVSTSAIQAESAERRDMTNLRENMVKYTARIAANTTNLASSE